MSQPFNLDALNESRVEPWHGLDGRMKYHITIRRAGVPWWKRLLRRHWRVELVKHSQELFTGNRTAIRAELAGSQSGKSDLFEYFDSGTTDTARTEVLLIEEAEIYGNT